MTEQHTRCAKITTHRASDELMQLCIVERKDIFVYLTPQVHSSKVCPESVRRKQSKTGHPGSNNNSDRAQETRCKMQAIPGTPAATRYTVKGRVKG